jgi:hypothetical protein
MYNISSVTFKIDIVYSNLGLTQGLECLFRMFHFYRVDLPSIVTNETNFAVSTMQAASRDATQLDHTIHIVTKMAFDPWSLLRSPWPLKKWCSLALGALNTTQNCQNPLMQ